MTAEAPAKTHCPNCGAQLHRSDLSLCAYCATPLTLGGRIERTEDETTRRLLRIRENPAFAAAIAARPFDPEVLARVNRATSWGWALLLAGLALGTLRFVAIGVALLDPLLLASLGLVLGALLLFARAGLLRSHEGSLPVVRRPALVLDRRSETTGRRGRAATTYFFTMRFDDGSEGEFCWPGRGTLNEPLTPGVTGVACTRGQKLVEFKRL